MQISKPRWQQVLLQLWHGLECRQFIGAKAGYTR